MPGGMDEVIRDLRAEVRSAEELARRAAVRDEEARRALRSAGDDPRGAERAAAAAAELGAAREALRTAEDELENAEQDAQEASNDEPIGPQGDYTLREIVAKLSHRRQRATYTAVGQYLQAPAWYVRGWFAKRPSPDNSFVVAADGTGEPTRYPREAIHPALKQREEILRTGDALLAWLQDPANGVPVRR